MNETALAAFITAYFVPWIPLVSAPLIIVLIFTAFWIVFREWTDQ